MRDERLYLADIVEAAEAISHFVAGMTENDWIEDEVKCAQIESIMTTNPKRLIEVDLPIRRISAHARREKSTRRGYGHISTLRILWARRPLAACRAVICAALWPDPADDACPQAFRDAEALALCDFAEQVRTDETLAGLSRESWSRWLRTTSATMRGVNPAA